MLGVLISSAPQLVSMLDHYHSAQRATSSQDWSTINSSFECEAARRAYEVDDNGQSPHWGFPNSRHRKDASTNVPDSGDVTLYKNLNLPSTYPRPLLFIDVVGRD